MIEIANNKGKVPYFSVLKFKDDFLEDHNIGWNDEAVIEDYKNNYLKNNKDLINLIKLFLY